jgi:hypothetical protein
MKRAAKLAVISALLAACYAQEATQKTLEAVAIAAVGVDAWATNRNMMIARFSERNPIARPFVTHGTAELAGYFAVSAAGFYLIDRKLSQHHKRAARAWELAIIGSEAFSISISIREYRRR